MDIYRIVDKETDEEIGVYIPPMARNEYNFKSIEAARNSNCHEMYKDKLRYKIRKYKLVLVEDDCDPATEEEIAQAEEEKRREKENREKYNQLARKVYGKTYEELSVLEQISIRLETVLVETVLGEDPFLSDKDWSENK